MRPARYCITRDGLVIVSSEAGVVDVPEADIVEKGRLGPGQSIAVDLESHETLKNWQIKQRIASAQPYGEWLQHHRIELEPQPFLESTQLEAAALLRHQIAFGYNTEDVEMVIQEMAAQGVNRPSVWVTTFRWQCYLTSLACFTTISNNVLPK